MPVTLRERKPNSDGSITMFLDIYHKGERSYEFLNHLKLEPGTSPAAREKRKENRAKGEEIENQRRQELLANDFNMQLDQSKRTIVLQWMEKYLKEYDKKDIRNMAGVIKKFSTFLHELNKSNLVMKDFSETIVIKFRDRLKKDCEGEGAKSYYARFRKMVKQACRENLLSKNPCEFVRPPQGEASVKDTLTFEELQVLANTPTESPEIKKAFIYASYTSLRFCDIKALRWNQIDLTKKTMKVKQQKTGKTIIVPLGDPAIELLGKEGEGLVFKLPSANGTNKTLKALVARAKIKKQITFHCARHSFGTNMTALGVDLYTTGNLMGHSSVQHTRRYARPSEEINRAAIGKMPAINLSSGRIIEEGPCFELVTPSKEVSNKKR